MRRFMAVYCRANSSWTRMPGSREKTSAMSIRPGRGEPGVGPEQSAREGLRRLAGTRRRFAALPAADAVPAAGPLLAELQAALRALSPAARQRILDGPDVRGFLAETGTQ